VALSIVGILAGCGNANNITETAPTNTTKNTVANVPANSTTDAMTNTTTGTNATTSTKQTTSNTTSNNSGLSEKTYPSTISATNAIMSLEADSSGQFVPSGSDIDLGLGIKAQHSTSSGLNMYKWQEGRWSIVTQFWANTPGALSVTKNMLSYLHTHMLPVPHNKGFITAVEPTTSKRADDLTTTIAWQIGNHVYELKETGNPVTALKTVTTK